LNQLEQELQRARQQNPHSGGGTNGVNVTTLNPGTFELPTFYDLLYEIPVFWAVV
jgi:hypothetical protein